MKKLLARTLLAATALALSHTIAASETLRIATEGAYPPFNELMPDGTLAGFDVDIAKAVCENMKVQCEFVKQDWDGLIPGLLAKKFDLNAASMTITDERKKKVDFTSKYYQTPSYFSAKKEAGLEVTPEGLKGKSIGVQRGTIHACYIEKLFKESDVKLYPSQQEAFSDLMSGRVDVVFSDMIGAVEQLLKPDGGQDYELVGDPQKDAGCLGEGVGIAMRKDNGELRDRVDKAIAAIREDGTYETINAKYFDFDIYGD